MRSAKSLYILGIIMSVGIFGPAMGFGFGAIFSQMHVTLKGKIKTKLVKHKSLIGIHYNLFI